MSNTFINIVSFILMVSNMYVSYFPAYASAFGRLSLIDYIVMYLGPISLLLFIVGCFLRNKKYKKFIFYVIVHAFIFNLIYYIRGSFFLN